jgi:RNA polymerase sigma factor (sigma-70 family)
MEVAIQEFIEDCIPWFVPRALGIILIVSSTFMTPKKGLCPSSAMTNRRPMTRRFAASWRFGRAWFLRIMGNVGYGALRARHLQCNLLSLDEQPGTAVPDSKPGSNVSSIQNATKLRVREALEALPFELRTVIILREFERFSYKEISGIVGVPVSRVMSRLARARQRLVTLLQNKGENE